MSNYFLDTSAVVKHYRLEIGSSRVDGVLADSDSRCHISALTIVEFASTLQRLKNRGEIQGDEMQLLLARFDADLGQVLVVLDFPRSWPKAARALVLEDGIRTLDVLQLVVALGLKAAAPIFVAADDRLLQAAQANGLSVLNPALAS